MERVAIQAPTLATAISFSTRSLNWPLSDGHSLRLTTFGEIKRSENPGKPEQDRDTFNNSVSLSYDGTLRSGGPNSALT